MNRRTLIAVAAVAALALAAAAAWMLSRDDAADAPPAPSAAHRPARDPGPPQRVEPSRDRPAPRRADAPEAAGSTYQLPDGTQVRDHRSGDDREPPIWPGDVPHPSRSPVTPQVTSAVMGLVRPVVLRCFKDVPDAAFAEDAVVVTRTVVTIDEGGKLTVTELGPQSRGIDRAEAATATAIDAAHECVRAGTAGLSTQVDNPAVAQTVLVFPIKPQKYRR